MHKIILPTNHRSPITVRGFTLIELLVSISIIGILIGLSLFGLAGARQSSRDARRKGDLEQIRSGIELYKSDCGRYPAALPAVGQALVGDPSLSSSCLATNTYIAAVPGDALDPDRTYFFSSAGTPPTTYMICTALEQVPDSPVVGCGSCVVDCNYKVINP